MSGLHGTAVFLPAAEGAVLLRGRPGSGKSDLALRLIAAGGTLVGDDRLQTEQRGDKLILSAPEQLRGILEVRGVGLVRRPFMEEAPLIAVIDLISRDVIERLPARETAQILGVEVPRFSLHAFDVAAKEKVALAIELARDPALLVQ